MFASAVYASVHPSGSTQRRVYFKGSNKFHFPRNLAKIVFTKTQNPIFEQIDRSCINMNLEFQKLFGKLTPKPAWNSIFLMKAFCVRTILVSLQWTILHHVHRSSWMQEEETLCGLLPPSLPIPYHTNPPHPILSHTIPGCRMQVRKTLVSPLSPHKLFPPTFIIVNRCRQPPCHVWQYKMLPEYPSIEKSPVPLLWCPH